MKRLKDLEIREISILFESPPAVPSAMVLVAKSADSEWTPEFRAQVLKVLDAVEQELEKAKVDYVTRKKGLEGLMATPVRKAYLSDDEWRVAVARWCDDITELLRSESLKPQRPQRSPDVRHDDGGSSEDDFGDLQRETRAAEFDNQRACDAANADWIRRGRTMG